MNKIKKILSIDGGGIKGAIPASFLAMIEEISNKSIADHFDLIAGTSTGGIIAIGLALGMTAKEIKLFYEADGPRIFSQEEVKSRFLIQRLIKHFRKNARSIRRLVIPKYSAASLESALKKAFGEKTLGDCSTRVVIPAFDRQRREVHIFKTSHHPRLEMDWREKAVNVALATSAAPTYLPGHRLNNGISLLDGGIWANNPIGLAAVEAISVLGWQAEQVRVLSLGCSEEVLAIPENTGLAGLALKVADVFMLGQDRGAIGTAKLLLHHTELEPKIFRYQPIVPQKTYALDSADKINEFFGIGAAEARMALPTINTVFLDSLCENFIPVHKHN